MADYSRYKTETLKIMLSSAWEKYYRETMKASGNWRRGMRLSEIPRPKAWKRAKKRYDAIYAELKRREMNARNKCLSCTHNVGTDGMSCEYACTGVETVMDEGRIVASCLDYEKRKG